jgi:hypothetical protein
MHDLPHCSRSHLAVPLVRPENPRARSGEWRPATPSDRQPRRFARWAIIAAAVVLATVLIVLAALAAGDAAADGFGPLIPASTPSLTPYPEGWTP